MPTLTLIDGVKNVKVDSDQQIPSEWASGYVLTPLAALNVAAPISTLTWERVAPGVYEYRLVLKDGRKWIQTVTFDGLAEPLQTFNISDGWRSAEFSLSRPVRECLIANSISLGFQKFKVTYV